MRCSWLVMLFKAMCRGVQKRQLGGNQSSVPFRRLEIEPLEARLAPAVTSHFLASSGLLTVSSSSADAISVAVVGSRVQINGSDPASGPLAASELRLLRINGGPGA